MTAKEIKIGIADMKIARQDGILITHALGSCVGITLYDPQIRLGALIHIMLPEAGNTAVSNPYKFADSGIRETLRKLAVFGASKHRFICKIAGGAQMFAINGGGGIGNIGQRNIASVKRILQGERIRISGEDVGSNYARTMLLDVKTGMVKVRTIGKKEVIL
ncbi:chemotaxis protein CheD [Zhenpiania hominis]|uniref:Probable chemoreceptor glutamine deamidase CheD n=1 Tax=Zhenpiania hominis TaxID=2763644 RepID=A0A923NI63_9FIRM|nr:chemotaxis protein CheD [Zhenpiania hominis]MBC6678330.1 chemotaxis protein CheD [Zhenpiania hominis]